MKWTRLWICGAAAICLLGARQAAIGADTNFVRVVEADLKQVKGPRSMVWQDCVGAGRVAEALRDNWRRQLEECHRDLGFKYIRMHGLLQDELGVYSEDANGQPHYNWQYIDEVYDYLLGIGMKPFVEIGFMPNALASDKQTIFWWNANVTPPADYDKWDALIGALVRHWTDRYGPNEVASWRFEVWNEPNYPGFWRVPSTTTAKDAYFELYEHTAKVVKGVNVQYIVGGPAGAGPAWTKDFIEFCQEKAVPVDFISYHAYGLGNGPSGLDQFGNQNLYLSTNLDSVADIVDSQLPVIKSTQRPDLPVYITEWSASYSPRDPVHDATFMAPYILEQLRRTESVGSMSYWTFTDIFEENGPAPRPFHGGFGLINFQGIHKPAYWAYHFLRMLGNTEIQNTDSNSWVCVDGKGGVQVLLWDLESPTRGKLSNQEYFFQPHTPRTLGRAAVRLNNLPGGNYRVKTYRISSGVNDPYGHYLDLGSPADLKPDVVAELNAQSTGKPVSESSLSWNGKGECQAALSLSANDVYFLSFERQ